MGKPLIEKKKCSVFLWCRQLMHTNIDKAYHRLKSGIYFLLPDLYFMLVYIVHVKSAHLFCFCHIASHQYSPYA